MGPLTAATSNAPAAAEPSKRIGVLDVLRGIALTGMIFVHVRGGASDPGSGFGHAYLRFVHLFLAGRLYSMFAILFGVGFAVQMRRAEARGDRLVPRYLRRLLALAAFGFITEVFFGYWVLLQYAIWGVPLLLVRRWSTKALVVTLVLCAVTGNTVYIARATYLTVVGRTTEFPAFRQADVSRDSTAWAKLDTGSHSTHYPTVVAARLRNVPYRYSRPYSYLPFGDFTLFLIGLLGLRLGLFDHPAQHKRFIVSAMVFGAASWAVSEWLLIRIPFSVGLPPTTPLLVRVTAMFATRFGAFGLIRDSWLAFTYIGAILLLVAQSPGWLQRLSPLATIGRMALTNYVLQAIVLDLAFAPYAFGATITASSAPLAALVLVTVEVIASYWWLSRYRYGPLEWLWRSITYARWQPLRRAVVATAG